MHTVEAAPPGSSADGVVALQITTAKTLDLRAEVAAVVAARGWALLELRPVVLSLETIYLMVTGPQSAAEGGDEVPRRLPA